MKTIEIFKAGTHTAMSGATLSFGESDLAATAAAYDPALHEAPIVVGHPKSDAPAYGWVGGLSFADGALAASPRQVDPAFAELVAEGKFKKVSASFYTPTAPGNPKKGVYYLRHVGFLGAQPPSVKGLKAVEFADENEGVVTVEFGDMDVAWSLKRMTRMFRRMREFLVVEFGAEKIDKVIDPWELDGATDDAAAAAADAARTSPGFTEPNTDTEENDMTKISDADKAAETAAKEQKIAADAQKLEKDKADFAEAKRTATVTTAIDALEKEGRVLPAEKAALVAFAAALDDKDTVQFAEGDDGKKTRAGFFLGFLKALPPRVDFAERSADDGKAIDPANAEKVAEEAVAYQESQKAKGIVVGTDVAVRHVLSQQK